MLSSRSNLSPTRCLALAGALTWAAWLLVARPDRTAGLLMLSPFVLVPLVIGLTEKATVGEQQLLRTLQRISLPLAVLAAVSFSFEQGLLAATLTLPWFGFTLVMAVEGLLRLLGRRQLVCADLGFDLALMLIAVGGAWLVLSRYGATLGFDEFIVELTAVHFHYAGFALPAVAASLARHRHAQRARGGVLPIAVGVGIVATAIGITLGGIVEWLAATAMALVGFVVATELVALGRKSQGHGRVLVTIAGCALGAGMVMALIWAWTIWFGVSGPGLDLMVATHGGLNALGFGLIGLIGLHAVPFTENTERRSLRVGAARASELAAVLSDATPFDATAHPDVLAGDHPAGWRRDDFTVTGSASFGAARNAINEWAGHRAAGIELSAPPAIAVGKHVALAIPVFGLATVSARSVITHVVDEADRFGFVYASTQHHPMDGVEAFLIEPHGTGVRLTIPVVWRPAIVGARLIQPLTRWLQRRALARYMHAIATSTDQGSQSS